MLIMFISVRNVSIYIYIYNVIDFLIGAIIFVAILSVTEQKVEIKNFLHNKPDAKR
jgi:hypothetical protein